MRVYEQCEWCAWPTERVITSHVKNHLWMNSLSFTAHDSSFYSFSILKLRSLSQFSQRFLKTFLSPFSAVFSRVHATLWPTLSVCRSVGPSVGRSHLAFLAFSPLLPTRTRLRLVYTALLSFGLMLLTTARDCKVLALFNNYLIIEIIQKIQIF